MKNYILFSPAVEAHTAYTVYNFWAVVLIT